MINCASTITEWAITIIAVGGALIVTGTVLLIVYLGIKLYQY